MRTLIDFSILQEYSEKVQPRGDKLLALAKLVDWMRFCNLATIYIKTKVNEAAGPILALL
jgi:hypothetical protein